MFSAGRIRRTFLQTSLAVMIAWGASSAAMADIRPPVPKPQGTPVKVVVGEATGPMVIEIPANLVKQQEANQGAAPGAASPRSSLPTIMAGLALALAIVSGGMLAMRYFRRSGRLSPAGTVLGSAVVLALVASLAATAQANKAPPIPPRPFPNPEATPLAELTAEVKVVKAGQPIRILLSPAQAAAIAGQKK